MAEGKDRNAVRRLADRIRELQKALAEKRQPGEKEKTPQFAAAPAPGKEDRPQARAAERIGAYVGQYNAFTREVLGRYAREDRAGNVILSPFSILTLLGIAASSVDGPAREEILAAVKRSVDEFVGDAPQFDDITMLCLKYIGV